MTGVAYREILEENLLESVKNLNMSQDWVIQHDNDPKHTAAVVTNWLDQHRIKRLKWPSFSPDINPIEHLWDEMERRKQKEQPKNVKELKETLIRVWKGIAKGVVKKLTDSVPNRLNEVIKSKGYPTRY